MADFTLSCWTLSIGVNDQELAHSSLGNPLEWILGSKYKIFESWVVGGLLRLDRDDLKI